jgi:predicted amidohydrolase
MRPFRAALIQMRGTADAEANLGLFEEGVREAVSRGAGLVCGPDNMYFSGSVRTLRECATPVPGPLTDHLSALAKKHSVYLSPGTIPESSATDKPYNTFLLFAPDGALIGKYRKRHLFKVNIPGTVTDDEGDYLLPGEWPSPVIETALGRIGAGICYDLRFPEQFLRLALDGALAPSLPDPCSGNGMLCPRTEPHRQVRERHREVRSQSDY